MRLLLTLVLMCLAIVDAAATPKPDFASDRFLVGTWSCTIKTPSGAATQTLSYEFTLDGHWLKLVNTETSNDAQEPVVTTHAYEGYEPNQRKWVYVAFGSDGGLATAYSEGWKNGVKVYTPVPGGLSYRAEARKISNDAMTEEVTVPGPKQGSWRRVFFKDCKRAR